MPSIHIVDRFVDLVEAGQGLEAMAQFYAENATMQENGAEPRVGKEALLKYEEAAQASVTDLKSRCIRPILVAGDVVVIRWIFEFKTQAGKAIRFEELAYQRWQADLIIQEQFFYDPAQFK